MSAATDYGARDLNAPRPLQGWGAVALLLGIAIILFAGITHVVAWLYVSLAPANMTDLDTRLGLGVCIAYALGVLVLAVFAIVWGAVGVRESRRTGHGAAYGVSGLFVAILGTFFWILAATNLLIVAFARLR